METTTTFDELFWEAVKAKREKREDISYLGLGGTSLGIFQFTEAVKNKMGISIPPEELLKEDATLINLKSKYLEG